MCTGNYYRRGSVNSPKEAPKDVAKDNAGKNTPAEKNFDLAGKVRYFGGCVCYCGNGKGSNER